MNNVYGNNVTDRVVDLPSGAMKCWVDYETSLPSGTVSRFYIYIHNRSSVVDFASSRLRLQIWRPADVTVPRFTLVYQQRVAINSITDGGAVFTVLGGVH